jgi:hypothetical protein
VSPGVELLHTLRARGIVVEACGDRLRYRPRHRVTEDELAIMRQLKPDLLRLLTIEPAHREALRRCYQDLDDHDRGRLATEAAAGDQLAQLVVHALACTPDPAAWRLYSRRLDRELRVARDAAAANELDGDGVRGDLPVVLADDLERLRDFDDRRLNDVLDVLVHLPGARLAELDRESGAA